MTLTAQDGLATARPPEARSGGVAPTRMAVLVVLFDVTDSANLWKNFRTFRERLDRRVDVFVAECSFRGTFRVPEAMQIDGTANQRLWQKERMLNLLLERLPAMYDAVCWMDADILFESPTWLDETLALLADHDVVFPYSTARRLDAVGGVERRQTAIPKVLAEGLKNVDRALGLAWAFRREWIDRHRFDDTHLAGHGDSSEFHALLGDVAWGRRHSSPAEFDHWLRRLVSLHGTRIGYAHGEIVHLYHGSTKNRQYRPAAAILREHGYNPVSDLRLGENGLWVWRGATAVYESLQQTFEQRQTDDNQSLDLFQQRFGRTRRTELPQDTGILTACDAHFFGCFQFLFLSIIHAYQTRVALVDLGLTDSQREWCARQPSLQLCSVPEDLIVPQGEKAWQTWSKPLYLLRSPFPKTLWLDADCVVNGGLETLADLVTERFFTAECHSPWARQERLTFPHKALGTKPIMGRLVMAGICGFDLMRDQKFLEDWAEACRKLSQLSASQRKLQDQEALQWIMDVQGLGDHVLPDRCWNDNRHDCDVVVPESFLHTLPRASHILHFYGKSKGNPPFWTNWGEVPVANAEPSRRYSDFLKGEGMEEFWQSQQAEWILSKHRCKELAASLGLRIPQTYRLPGPCVLKPDRDCGGRRVRRIPEPSAWILEEMIPHDVSYRLYIFNGQVRMAQVDLQEERPAGMAFTKFSYYSYPEWQPLYQLSSDYRKRPWLDIAPPVCLPQMAEMALTIARKISVPVRVDFFVTADSTPVFNEMSVTPGLVKDGRVTAEGDRLMGSWIG